MKTGDKAPDFTLKDQHGDDWNLAANAGRTVVLLFYPADDSPVCTAQLCGVRDNWEQYTATGAEVIGISTDGVPSHLAFAEKHDLPLRLLADDGAKVSALYDMKSWIPGRSARGVVVINANGEIVYHKVETLSLFKPKDDDVLRAIAAA